MACQIIPVIHCFRVSPHRCLCRKWFIFLWPHALFPPHFPVFWCWGALTRQHLPHTHKPTPFPQFWGLALGLITSLFVTLLVALWTQRDWGLISGVAGPGYQQPTKIEYIHLTASLPQMIKWNTTGQRCEDAQREAVWTYSRPSVNICDNLCLIVYSTHDKILVDSGRVSPAAVIFTVIHLQGSL